MILSDKRKIRAYRDAGLWGQVTLDGLVHNQAQVTPDRLVFVDPPNKAALCGSAPLQVSYAFADAVINRLAATMQILGLKRDDVVAIQMPNTVEQALAFLAMMRAGLIVCPLPLFWRETELVAALQQVAPRAIITTGVIAGHDHADMMRHVAFELETVRFVFGFGKDLPDGVMPLDAAFTDTGAGKKNAPARPPVDANAIATMCWQGTGETRPYPVARSHNQWISAAMMLMLEGRLQAGETVLSPYPLLNLLPLALLGATLMSAGTLVCHHPFDAEVYRDQIRDEKVGFACLPARAGKLFDAIGARSLPENLRQVAQVFQAGNTSSGSSCPLPGYEGICLDILVLDDYALLAFQRQTTEPVNLHVPLGTIRVPPGGEGGMNLLETRLAGLPGEGAEGGALGSGALKVRGPMVPDALFRSGDDGRGGFAVDSDGFADTGIRGFLTGGDAPHIEFLPPSADTFRHGGIPVSARELDDLYAGHDGLADAAALPVDDPVMGKRICAVIVPNPGLTVSFEDFRNYLRQRRVASFKFPDRLITVSEIPRRADGGIMRDKILDQL